MKFQKIYKGLGRILETEHLTEHVTRIVFQLAFILLAAKIAGEICERYIKIPPVLGELGAGVAIGPYALGGLRIGPLGSLFILPASASHNALTAVPQEIYVIAQVASIVLLFVAGLETNLKQFFRYAGPATIIAIGGVTIPFITGVLATVAFGIASTFTDPIALFMGAVMTATSVGITARVLADLQRLNSPEGVTVIAAAVIDDILGILVLTVVIGISATGQPSLGELGLIAGKAVGFWIGLTALVLLTSRWLFKVMNAFRVVGATLVFSLSLALLGAGLAEWAGLAMIIGAYSVGLALSETPLRHTIEESLMGVYHFLVPIFFAVMGMLVNPLAMGGFLVFSGVFTILAILSKVLGCGLPALFSGFNFRGGWRIGLGMLPRGEVALIISGVGLAQGIVNSEQFGVAIMMTVITTILAPVLLVGAFKQGGSGARKSPDIDPVPIPTVR